MQKKSSEDQTQKQKPTCYGEIVGAGVRQQSAKSPRDKQKQREYLQQKTEKFHLLSGPDAPTKLETRERQADGEKIM